MRILKALLIAGFILSAVLPVSAVETATVYHGIVRQIKGSEMVLMLKNGTEKKFKLTKETRVFLSGDKSPYNFIKKNSTAEVAALGNGKCIQVVVQEGPK